MILPTILLYFATVLGIGWASHRLLRGTGEDYFLATRSIGSFVLLMSLFGTHMTAFAILGASGEAYRTGIGVFAMMASSSALVVPALFFFVGTRMWALGKRNGYMTQAQFFRDRWQSDGIGLALFAVLVALLVPYILLGVMAGGITLNQITSGGVPEWVGSLLVAVAVLIYVAAGGLRGAAWANTFQTLVFMTLGVVAFFVVVGRIGGLTAALDAVEETRPDLLSLAPNIPPLKLLSYMLIPLSAGMFPHIFMHWLTARKAETFRLSIVCYPFCVAMVWLPTVLLGVVGVLDFPGLKGGQASSVLVRMIELHAPDFLAGLLAAGVFAAVMSSLDSQVLAVGTMFTQDIVRHYGYHDRMSERQQVLAGRLFVVGLLLLAFLLSLVTGRSIFSLGVWSFTGFAGLLPLAVAALFWRRSTKAGAFASLATTVVLWIWFFVQGWGNPDYTVGGSGVMPVAVVLLGSMAALIAVSLLTRPPTDRVLTRFFP